MKQLYAITLCLLSLCCITDVHATKHAKAIASHQSSLKQVREEIKTVAKDSDTAKKEREALQIKLKEADLKLSAIKQKLNKIHNAKVKNEKHLKSLSALRRFSSSCAIILDNNSGKMYAQLFILANMMGSNSS